MPVVWILGSRGFLAGSPPDPARRGGGGPGGVTSPPTPRGGPDLMVLLPKTHVADPVPGNGVPGWGVKLDQPPDSLFTPPRAGYNFDYVGG